MSGSSGFHPSSSVGSISCEDLFIKTRLASPIPAVVSELKTGDRLIIRLAGPTGPIQATTPEGDVAGSILSVNLTKLITCIIGGTEYVAEVTSVAGGDCQVSIYSRRA